MEIVTKEKFLTVGWNNVLTLALGLPTLIYVLVAFSTSFWTTRGGLIGLSIIGVLYWLVIEGHTSMRFAWLKENLENYEPVQQAFTHPLRLIRNAYNIVFWIFLLPFFTTVEYSTGFIAFTIIIFVRLVLNIYTNNVLNLTPTQFERYPFRIPWNGEWGKNDEKQGAMNWTTLKHPPTIPSICGCISYLPM